MNEDIPRPLVGLAVVAGLVAFSVGMYLEFAKPQWIGAHPITANLLSAFICFNVLILFVSFVLRRMRENEQAWRLHRPVLRVWEEEMAGPLGKLASTVLSDEAISVTGYSANRTLRIIHDGEEISAGPFRAALAEFLSKATDFVQLHGIDDPKLQSKIDALADSGKALPDRITRRNIHQYMKAYLATQRVGSDIGRCHLSFARARVRLGPAETRPPTGDGPGDAWGGGPSR